MSTWIWLNVPLGGLIFLAVSGPVWLAIKHPDTGPDGVRRVGPADPPRHYGPGPDAAPGRLAGQQACANPAGWTIRSSAAEAEAEAEQPLALISAKSPIRTGAELPDQETRFWLVPCPECELPAEVTDLFALSSTDGPVDHLALCCIAGHGLRMAVDLLPADTQQILAAARADPDLGGLRPRSGSHSDSQAGPARRPSSGVS